ncbi:MAG: gamma-glutamylcyclotransferase [Bdellovibrionales bacterium]|nr:gamma-glutamylcyclotransferase [Bdellovibrionales bacterium]
MNIFTYGTLSIPGVMLAVTGREFKTIKAVAADHMAYVLRDKKYPGLVAEAEGIAAGLIHVDVDQETLAVLDAFEDEIYERREMNVTTLNDVLVKVAAYVVPLNNRELLSDRLWDEDAFVTYELEAYLENCKRFRDAYLIKQEAPA